MRAIILFFITFLALLPTFATAQTHTFTLTWTDTITNEEGAGRIVRGETEKDFPKFRDTAGQQIARAITREVPGGTYVRGLTYSANKTERQKFLEQLGLKRESMSREKMKKQLGIKE